MIRYSFKTTSVKQERDCICCFRIYEDDDVNVYQIFFRYGNGMNEAQSDLFITHKGIDSEDCENSTKEVVKYYSGTVQKFENGKYRVPTYPLDKYLLNGLNTITDRFPQVVYRNDSDSIERFSSKCFDGCVYNFSAYINPGSYVLYKNTGFSERYTVFKRNTLINDSQIEVIHSKKYPSMMSMYDYETSELTLFKINNHDDADIISGKIRIIDTEECFDIFPNYYRIESIDDFIIYYDKYGISATVKRDPKHKDDIKYHHNRTIVNRVGEDIIMKIHGICYHPAIVTEHGFMYQGKGKGFMETIEATIINNKVSEVDQIFEQIDEKDFLIELTKERTKQ